MLDFSAHLKSDGPSETEGPFLSCNRRTGYQDEPHHAVCCEVLNLPSQVWALPVQSALAQAYRVMVERLGPLMWVLAQNR